MSKLLIELDHRTRDVFTNNQGLRFYILESVPDDVKYQSIDIAEIARRESECKRKLQIVTEAFGNQAIEFKPKYKKF